MNNFIQIGVYFATCFIYLVSGAGVTLLLWPRKWKNEIALVAPIIGAACLIIMTTALNCLGLPVQLFSTMLILLFLLFLFFLLLIKQQRDKIHEYFKEIKLINVLPLLIGLFSGILVTLPLILFKGFNPYNDTFTYISIADYIAKNGFLQHIHLDRLHPILTQVYLYQTSYLRMGAQFLLSLITKFFGYDLSINTFVPVTASFVFLFVLSIWLFCKIGLGLSNRISIIAIVFTAVNFSFPIGHALTGFFPQTIGIAFSAALLSLWTNIEPNIFRKNVSLYFLTSILIAAMVISYSEITPFIFLAAFIVIFLKVIRKEISFIKAIEVFCVPMIFGIIMSHIFFYGIIKNLKTLSSSVVGWDVKYVLWDYILMLFSFIPLNYNQPVPILMHPLINIAFSASTIFFIYIILKEFLCVSEYKKVLTRLAEIAVPFILILIYYGYFVKNPWNPSVIGQSWSIYKAVQYSFFIFPPLIAIAWYKIMLSKERLVKYIVIAASCLYIVTGVGFSVGYSYHCARIMASNTGDESNPISEYFKLRTAMLNLSDGLPINLIVPNTKHREMVAYFLQDVPLQADWSDDNYIRSYIDNNNAFFMNRPFLVYEPGQKDHAVGANMVLVNSTWQYDKDWYDLEQDGSGSWHWSSGNSSIALEGNNNLIKIEFLCMATSNNPAIDVYSNLGEKLTTFHVETSGWCPIELTLLLPKGTTAIEFKYGGKAVIEGNDPRPLAFAIKNLSITNE